jgi:hypothetical protein
MDYQELAVERETAERRQDLKNSSGSRGLGGRRERERDFLSEMAAHLRIEQDRDQ